MAIDPVCGMEINEDKTDFKLVYQDKTYFSALINVWMNSLKTQINISKRMLLCKIFI